MRNRLSFKQYNPSKPAKYGLLFKSINAVNYSFTFTATPYCGKPIGEPTTYYVSENEEVVKYLISKLQKHVDLQGRNILFDRLYTTVPLAQWLLSHNITCVGTIQANRRGIPVEIKQLDNRKPLSYECFWETVDNKISLHSYAVNTKSSGKRNVLLLTTMQPILETASNVALFCLPSNTTHKLQPMDKSVFRSFKHYWDVEVLKYWRTHSDRVITKARFGSI